MRPYLVKLVRDRIGQFLGGDGRTEYRPMPREQHVLRLREKLMHEATEYLLDPCAAELADVVEVVETLAALDPAVTGGMTAVRREQVRKRGERGGFIDGIGMYVTTLHPTDGEVSDE